MRGQWHVCYGSRLSIIIIIHSVSDRSLSRQKQTSNLIETVEIPLSFSMLYNSGFLEEICLNVSSLSIESVVILDVHVLPLKHTHTHTQWNISCGIYVLWIYNVYACLGHLNVWGDLASHTFINPLPQFSSLSIQVSHALIF